MRSTLEKIVELAPKTIDGCDHAGVTLVEGDRMRTPAAVGCEPAR